MKTQFDYRSLAQFRYELRRFLNLAEQAARNAGIEPQQFQALLAIKGLPDGCDPTVGALAERLQIHHNSTVELVNRLEFQGLLKRVRSRNDRRAVLLRITGRGQKIVRRLALPHRAELLSAGHAILRALRKALGNGGKARDRRSGADALHSFKRGRPRAHISLKR